VGAASIFTGLAYRYLQSLSLAVHTLLRNLYLVRSLSPKQIIAHAVTVYALRHVKLVPQVQGRIQNWIARIFDFLPLHKAIMLLPD
jgi:hypothetical protein